MAKKCEDIPAQPITRSCDNLPLVELQSLKVSEWSILIALFRATTQQKGFLQGETKQHAKLLFNRWEREGDKLVNLIESMSNEDELERITEVIEEAIHKLRENER